MLSACADAMENIDMKKIILFVAVVATCVPHLPAAVVERSVMRQMWPWENKILVECKVTGVTDPVDLKVTLRDGGNPCQLPASAFSGEIYSISQDGIYSIHVTPPVGTISARADRISVTVEPVNPSQTAATILYRVYDLDDGTCEDVTVGSILNGARGAWHWVNPVDAATIEAGRTNDAALTNLVWTGFNGSDVYKTSKLVMRYVSAKNESVNILNYPERKGTIAHSFWMAVYETTQAQWVKIHGTTPSFHSVGYTKPASNVSYDAVRGASGSGEDVARYYWPNDPSPDSFLGKLRQKTGAPFDLPWQAAWEYASQVNSGWKDVHNTNMNGTYNTNRPFGTENGCLAHQVDGTWESWATDAIFPGTYAGNSTTYAPVGSYEPSVLGLYDMHGNVGEMCVDWSNASVRQSDQASLMGVANVDLSNPARMRAWNADAYLGEDAALGTHRHCAGSSFKTKLGEQTPNYTYLNRMKPNDKAVWLGFRLVIVEND